MPPTPSTPAVPPAPAGSNSVNPFVCTHDAVGLLAFLVDVLDAHEVHEARTLDADGLVLHSELLVGDSTLTVADRKPGWPWTPALTRVYVHDAAATIDRARACGARVVTEPTDFFGDILARFADPFGNLWWVYQHDPARTGWGDVDDTGSADQDTGGTTAEESWETFTTPALEYVHATLVAAMEGLRDPRA